MGNNQQTLGTAGVNYVVFFRNMNLGHAGSPNRAQLEAAFRDAGCEAATSFQTNGTVIIKTATPDEHTQQATETIAHTCGYDDAYFIIPIDRLKETVTNDGYAHHTNDDTYRETVTFFRSNTEPTWELPWTNPKNDVTIFAIDDGIALGTIRKRNNTAGSPTREIETATSGVATTRTRSTIIRLLKKI